MESQAYWIHQHLPAIYMVMSTRHMSFHLVYWYDHAYG